MDRRLAYLRSQADGAMAARDFIGAADMLRQLIADLHYTVGPLDYQTLFARHALGLCMMETEQWHEAAGLFQELGPAFERRRLHKYALECRGNHAACLANMDNLSSAIHMLEHLIPDLEREFGRYDERVFISRRNLVINLAGVGKTSQALRQVNKLISDLERHHGPGEFLTAQARETREWIKSIRR